MEEKKQKVNPKRFYEKQCGNTRDVYQWEMLGTFHVRKKTGTKDVNAEIQLYKDQTDIKVLVERLLNGDPEILAVNARAFYGDVNQFPEEYHPAAAADSLKTLYENQPDSVKDKFQDFETFKNFFLNLTSELVEKYTQVPETPAAEPQTEVTNE